MSHQHRSVPANTSVARTSWPPETELILSSRKKVNLTLQSTAICVILQDAIDAVQLSLLFDNAFPDANTMLKINQDCLFSAAEKYKPGTLVIHERLTSDAKYFAKFSSMMHLIFSNNTSLKLFAATWLHLSPPSSEYVFCQYLSPRVGHDGGPCDCMTRVGSRGWDDVKISSLGNVGWREWQACATS